MPLPFVRSCTEDVGRAGMTRGKGSVVLRSLLAASIVWGSLLGCYAARSGRDAGTASAGRGSLARDAAAMRDARTALEAGSDGGIGAGILDAGGNAGGLDAGSAPDAGPFLRVCCGSDCVTVSNDWQNCGSCGHRCDGATLYCHAGSCEGPPPCAEACDARVCCGTQCCNVGQHCCEFDGTVGFLYECVDEGHSCPLRSRTMCASPDTPIATLTGERAIAELVPGDLVYSEDHGALTVVPIARVRRQPVHDHQVLRSSSARGACSR
jgi:hypothetical protein